ncbi:MAG: fucose isomerase [Treponema sp.]|nr:fucose isomerase [Treponema sp.]
MDIINKKPCIGLVVSNRAFFNPALALAGRHEIISCLDSLGFDYVIQNEKATASGCVENYRDAQILAEEFKKNRDRIDGIVVILPTFGDEIAVTEAIRLSGLDVPVLVQACNDDPAKVDVKSRRDAFCGKISVCNNLFQYGIPFTDTAFHTCDISSKTIDEDLKAFCAVCRVVKGIKNLRVGVIGTRPTAFQTMRFSEKILQKHGITVIPVDLSEILGMVNALKDDDPAVQAKVNGIKQYGILEKNVLAANVVKQAKFSAMVDKFAHDNNLQAAAIQCWNSLEANYGCAACLTMSMMGDILMKPAACEADVCGAVSMYALDLASKNAAALLDWNNNYKEETEICINTHCSNYPKSFFGTDIAIGNLDLLGETFGGDRCFGAVKGHVQPGDMTFFRISTDDVNGRIKAYLGEGAFIDREFNMDGGIAVCQVPGMRKLLATICQNGFEHHVAMVRSHVANIVYEAVSKYLGWKVYYHNKPSDLPEIL